MTWQDWCKRHATRFALEDSCHASRFREWVASFEAQGFTPDEVDAASLWLANNAPPEYLSHHLTDINDRVRLERLRTRNAAEATVRRDAEPERSLEECALCAGLGLVLGLTVEKRYGNGRKGRSCVTCRCPAGVRLGRLKAEAGFPIVGLDEHERHHPDWRERVTQEDVSAAPPSGMGGVIEGILKRAQRRVKVGA